MPKKLTFTELKKRKITKRMFNDVCEKGACSDFRYWYERSNKIRPVTFNHLLLASQYGRKVAEEWLEWGLETESFPTTWVTAMCSSDTPVVLTALVRNLSHLTERQIDLLFKKLGSKRHRETLKDNLHVFDHIGCYTGKRIVQIFDLITTLDEDTQHRYYRDLYTFPAMNEHETQEMLDIIKKLDVDSQEELLERVLASGTFTPAMLQDMDILGVSATILFNRPSHVQYESEFATMYLDALDNDSGLSIDDRAASYSEAAQYITDRSAGDNVATRMQGLPLTLDTDRTYRRLAENKALSAKKAEEIVGLRNVSPATIYAIARNYRGAGVRRAIQEIGPLSPQVQSLLT